MRNKALQTPGPLIASPSAFACISVDKLQVTRTQKQDKKRKKAIAGAPYK